MSHILGVKFRESGQIYYFASGPYVVNVGDHVIVNTEQGYGLGAVVQLREDTPPEFGAEELKAIYRIAAPEDVEKRAENDTLASEAFSFCRKCIRDRDLEMKLVDVEVFFDRSKIVFYFTAPNRIDFRELVKDLVKNYRTRIELRQIGVRHETQMIGAIGNCGQVCCCRRFLRKFAPVTIKMAKEQNLFLNPSKISGMCGRLLCCLSYEQENYETFHRQCPKIGKKFTTPQGVVKVLRANMFRRSLFVLTETGEEKEITLDEWKSMDLRRPDAPESSGGAAQAGTDAGADDSNGQTPEAAATDEFPSDLERVEGEEAAGVAQEQRPRRDARQGARPGARPNGRPGQRSDGRQGARPGQRPEGKDSRPESRQDSRQEARSEGRPEARSDAKGEARPDNRPDQRQEKVAAEGQERRDAEPREPRQGDNKSKRKRKRKPKPKTTEE
jgi:cell fate regulator YaaT (PSP1 superfamily)